MHSHRPWSPPIVQLAGDGIGHLLCWEKHERDGSWYAWVSWIQSTGDPVRHRHHVVSGRAEAARPWRTRTRTPEYHGGCSAPTGRSGRGPRPDSGHVTLTIPATSRATMTGPSA